ncbi:uncharacterized protein MYCFIDRAFT_209650 [Pseudocercospora fijiensis CIRAD86]|uniref:Uncharacterized protein n=1 Tax=Pseudocercospora fijiensis (strain CIRAD86) TaxID=383855 RepID=N1QAF4_PSEFD|nr:uncharacterized protein MYCFIDRAFT_209650 [Pseudocercospora fijiensis CIRAD86]EME87912.1 hypothetical protein MYCFIDRAFT_209650 [Pseudocercospora fijiensis CIRAD86]
MLPIEVFLLVASSGALALNDKPQDHAHQDVLADSRRGPEPVYTYRCFKENIESYPPPKLWLSFSELWNINRERILTSNGGNTYLQHHIQQAILKVSTESNIDARLILGLVMGESRGKASSPCVGGNVSRCGMLHALNGSSLDESESSHSVERMVREGISGSPEHGLGYAQLVQGKPPVANVTPGCPFSAARAYHSGAVREDANELERDGHDVEDAGFVNDFANRLLGWDGRGEGFKEC